ALSAAQAAGRADLEANAAIGLAGLHVSRFEDREAGPLIEHALELAEESGSLLTRASALAARGNLLRHAGEFDEAEALIEQALAIVVESGAAVVQGHLTHQLGIVAWGKRDLAKAERQFREAIRILSSVEDRGTLC